MSIKFQYWFQKCTLSFAFIILRCNFSFAQEKLTLNAKEVISILKNYHPVIRQTNIAIEQSKTDILQARAAFDPVLRTYLTQKTFNGENYYQYVTPEINIPTWYGIEVNAGFENLQGNRTLNPDTKGQTNYLGFSVPLAKNLVIDKRRAYLQQAKLFNQMTITEQQVIVNDILFDAMQTYWNWVRAYQTYLIVKSNVEVNEKRLDFVRKSYKNGERPAIDSVEALSQLMSFQLEQNKQYLDFQQAGNELNNFLWNENQVMYQLPESVVPQENWDNEQAIQQFDLSLGTLLASAQINHPELRLYHTKLSVLAIDKKLKFQELLPKLDFEYNFLGKGYNSYETISKSAIFQNNYQYGLKFEMPLRLSQGRASYQLAKLKIENTELDFVQKRQKIELKVKYYFNEMSMLKKQIEIQQANYANYQRLVKAEMTRFDNGESSLFLINSRETKALEALEKLIEIKMKYFKSIYALQWSAGLLR